MTDDDIDRVFRQVDIELYHNAGRLMATTLMEPEYAELPRCHERIQVGFSDVYDCGLPRGHELLGSWSDRVSHNTIYGVQNAEKYYREHPGVTGELMVGWQKLCEQWQAWLGLYYWLKRHQFTHHGEHDHSCGRCGCVINDVFVHAAWHEMPETGGGLVAV